MDNLGIGHQEHIGFAIAASVQQGLLDVLSKVRGLVIFGQLDL